MMLAAAVSASAGTFGASVEGAEETALCIGPVAVGFPVVQAALSGYSDWPMRVLARRHGASYAICEVMLDLKQGFAPRASSSRLPNGQIVSRPLEDLSPFLDREELRQNMLIPLVDDYSVQLDRISAAPPKRSFKSKPEAMLNGR